MSTLSPAPSYLRSLLKWPGGKYGILANILAKLPKGKQLVEPFAGSAVVFLNTQYEHSIIADVNADLISLYQLLKTEGVAFIDYARSLFVAKNNVEARYYALRKHFNASRDVAERAALFLYLNRHGYNGLCRYNLKGEYNVPFGRYKKPFFPQPALQAFHQKAQRATIICQDYRTLLTTLSNESVVYCDPPYVPITATAYFTQYSGTCFGAVEHQALADLAKMLSKKGIPVLLSNHDTPMTRALYQGSQLTFFPVRRAISCRGESRLPVNELLALFQQREQGI